MIPNLLENSKKTLGFDYIDLDFQHVDQKILERAKTEKLTFKFLKTHWLAYSATSMGVYYKLDLLVDNSGFCTCSSFVHKQSKYGKPCKHLIALDQHITKKVG